MPGWIIVATILIGGNPTSEHTLHYRLYSQEACEWYRTTHVHDVQIGDYERRTSCRRLAGPRYVDRPHDRRAFDTYWARQ